MNGDGYADVIVGAPYYDNGQTDEGRAFVYHGSRAAWRTPAWTAESDQAGAWFGVSVGDGGRRERRRLRRRHRRRATCYDNGQTDEGRAFVYHGGAAAGLSARPPAWTAESDQAGAYFGRSVGTAGDVNGDGYADVIVGAPDYDNGQTDEGRGLRLPRRAAGLSATRGLDGREQPGRRLLRLVGGDGGRRERRRLRRRHRRRAGYDNGQTDEGRAFVYPARAAGPRRDRRPGRPRATRPAPYFGYSVGTAGDVNGDGYADVIVGAPNYDNGQTDEGRAFVYYGSRRRA